MKMTGTGEVFLADTAQEIHLLYLENDAITVNGENLLAFDAGIDWDIRRVEGVSGMMGGGLFNMALTGTGWVAIVSDGPPVLLNTGDAPTFADPQAAITWASSVQTGIKTDIKLKNFIGRGSGESVQMSFAGPGLGARAAERGTRGPGARRRRRRRRRAAGQPRLAGLAATLHFLKSCSKIAHVSDPTCPVCATADIICGKWTILVIRDLAEGRSRFCELERSLAGISPRTLSLRLRALEEQGIVERHTYPEVPPRVEYSLTAKGEALVPLIEDMRRYGREWLGVDDCARHAGRAGRRLARRSRTRQDTRAAAPKSRRMRNRALHDALRDFALEAAALLTDELKDGAEVEFDVVDEGGGRGPGAVPLRAAHRRVHRGTLAAAARAARLRAGAAASWAPAPRPGCA